MEYTSVVRVRLELGLAFLPPGSRGRAQKNRSGSRVGVRRRAQRSTLYVLLLCAVLRVCVCCVCVFFSREEETQQRRENVLTSYKYISITSLDGHMHVTYTIYLL